MSIKQLFTELIEKIPAEAREAFLPIPASEQLEAASEALAQRTPGAKLPSEIVELYETCGGQPWEINYEDELFPTFGLNPLERAISDYKELCNLYEFDAKPYETNEFPKTWYDYRLFPFGWAPGTGTVHCVLVDNGEIYDFNPDGGIHLKRFESVQDLLEKSLEYQAKEFGR